MGRMSHGGLETHGPDAARLPSGATHQDPDPDEVAASEADAAPLPEIDGLTITERLDADAGGDRARLRR